MAHAEQHSTGLADLLGGLASDISGLFRKEIQLAKAEASEKLDSALSIQRPKPRLALFSFGFLGFFGFFTTWPLASVIGTR